MKDALTTIGACLLALAAVVIAAAVCSYFHPAVPEPVFAAGEEPCLRTTTGTYTRNYPPQGTTLHRRPVEWGVCNPFPPYKEP